MFDVSVPSETQLLVDAARRFGTQEVQPLENEAVPSAPCLPRHSSAYAARRSRWACSR